MTSETDKKSESENESFKSDKQLLASKRDEWTAWLRPSCIPVAIILVLIILIAVLPFLGQNKEARDENEIKRFLTQWDRCAGDKCRITVLESIPENLTYPDYIPNTSVFESWKFLINNAKESIDIASSYWTLRGSDMWQDPSDWQGEEIFKLLVDAGKKRQIKIRIAQNQPSPAQRNKDTEELQEIGAAEVRSLDFQKLLGAGILHTKMWLVDSTHIYLGSANLDWRSLTQVKEAGVAIYNCTCLAEDMSRIFQIYWDLGKPGAVIPPRWPADLSTRYNDSYPLKLTFNDSTSYTFLASSPPELCADGRTSDIDAILHVINKASKFVWVAVMDYYPATLYTDHIMFWPVIDDALKKAAVERQIEVKILASHWNHTVASMPYFLNSLAVLNNSYASINIEVKLFVVPSFTKEQALIPFARVNHNKYMVTDNAAYVGTSNWSADYFVNTAGIGLVVNQTQPNEPNATQPVKDRLRDIFSRDWHSEYAKPLSNFLNALKTIA